MGILYNMCRALIVLISVVSLSSSQITSIENDDGSYSIGYTSESHGDTGEAIAALLTWASGRTPISVNRVPDKYRRFIPRSRELKSAFMHSIEELIKRVNLILKRNPDVTNVVKRVFQIIGNLFRYLTRVIHKAVTSWANQRYIQK